MSEIFISYARTDEVVAEAVADALKALGYRVWRDDELPAHRAYSEVIEERLEERGRTPAESNLEEMEALWQEAKARERSGR